MKASREDACRIDKWLWFARFCKTRTLAQKLCEAGQVDVNGTTVIRSYQTIRPGDVLTLRQPPWIRTVTIAALAHRRGPPAEARLLFIESAPAARLVDPAMADRQG
ncbi:MAG: ribosome-associated heat shock protein Hsp15 [Rhodospirillaceae bacterium]|nr:MAG: ribosome-associated heat shock protein Hsp15 [Rhodospirillaceae bacterium]